jgi:glycosidase
MKTPRRLSAALLLSLGLAACADGLGGPGTSTYTPPGTGGFDTGTTGTQPNGTGANGTGANGTTSTGAGASGGYGGTGGTTTTTTTTTTSDTTPVCADADKRCDHLFTYPAGSQANVEVHGSFDAWGAGVAMTKNGASWEATVPLPWNAAVEYKFVVDGTWVTDPNNPSQVSDNYGGFNSELAAATCATWSCAGGSVTPPTAFDWRDAVLYFVFVDRFANGDKANDGSATSGVSAPADYQHGDWAGVKQKVDAGYFTDLRVNVLWLSVPMDNTEASGIGTDGHQYSAYHGYWPKNLDQTESRFGSMADLKALVTAAHQKNIKVIVDYAMNHVHETAPIYSQHPDWFWPKDLNGQSCICGSGACAWDGPNAKRCWFTDYLPDFNFTNAAARQYSVDNAIWWVKQTGIDGLRLDAVKHIEDQWLYDLRSRVSAEVEPSSGQHFYMVGETYTGDTSLIKYYVKPSMLDGQFDFPMRARLIQSLLRRDGGGSGVMSALEGFLAYNDTFYGSGVMSTFIGNHDVPRAIHFAEDSPAWGNDWADGKDRAWSNQPGQPGGTSAYERLGNAFTLLFTSRGVPLVYYGDEVGLAGAGDPDNRRFMQWSGYSAGQTLLQGHLKKLGAIRASHDALRRGTRAGVSSTAETLVYRMTLGADVVWVAINRADGAQSVSGLPSGTLHDLLGGGTVSGPSFSLPARSSMILTQ